MNDIAKRLKEARIAAGYRTAKQFADEHGIPQGTYALHEGGKRGLGRKFSDDDQRETLVVYAEKLGVRSAWLRFGEGPMRSTTGGETEPGREPADAINNPRAVENRQTGHVELLPGTQGFGEYPRTLKILGHAKAGTEGFFLDNGEVQGMAPRPPALNGVKHAFAVIIRDDSMFPAYEPDDLIFVNPSLPIVPPMNVVIELIDGQAFVKRLIRRTESTVICRQWNPDKEVRFDPKRIKAIYRILRPKELGS